MIASSNAKLSELRCKTNRDLVSLIDNKLERGLDLAGSLDSHNYALAERDVADVEAWLPLLTASNPLVRRRLQLRLAELRSTLDRNAAPQLHARAAC